MKHSCQFRTKEHPLQRVQRAHGLKQLLTRARGPGLNLGNPRRSVSGNNWPSFSPRDMEKLEASNRIGGAESSITARSWGQENARESGLHQPKGQRRRRG